METTEIHWLDERDLVTCTGHTPLPGIAWTRRESELSCENCYRRLHGRPMPKLGQVSASAEAFIQAVLGGTHYADFSRMRKT